jgi:hypothetical protein
VTRDEIVSAVAAKHPQYGASCMWCGCFMSIFDLEAEAEHVPSCVWLSATRLEAERG